ncbi:TPA: conjugative relaxase, partial [Escherichia coli]|nr:conjugative relaxase [Escherichia coli]
MLSFSVVKSAGSAGNYYTDKDNYYVLGSMGERWAGQGAEQLGLQGSVDKDVFTRLLEGRLPDGADLSRMQDGSNKHRPGYDLTFSAPKSVSMMAMLGGDKRLIDAHNQAVDFAVRQVEALASTRVMTDGQSETVLTGNLVMALFNHDTSRDQDPQLHTHVVVANVTQHNGEWKTLSSDKVGKTGFSENVLANRIAFGKIYQSELRQRVELITGRRQLQEGMVFTPGSTVIVDQGEKLSLKETLTLLDGAARHNVQVLITDSGQRTGTGSALMAMKDAGVNTYRWQGGEQRPATIISEPDRNVRYDRLAGDFAASVKAGEESVAQVSGVREQAILTQAIRSELKTQGVLGHPEVTMTALSPVWLDSRSRYLRDMYRPGMVMEQWNPETRSHDRYVIDRVTAQSHSLTLRDAQGETQVVRISSLDSSWSLFRPEKMPVADGERLRVTGKIPGLRVSGGDRLQVASVSEDAMTVVVPGRAEPATLPVADSPFTALKLENGWVETPGHSVSDSATV